MYAELGWLSMIPACFFASFHPARWLLAFGLPAGPCFVPFFLVCWPIPPLSCACSSLFLMHEVWVGIHAYQLVALPGGDDASLQLQVLAFQCAWALPRWAVEHCLEVLPELRSVCSFGAGCGPVRLAVYGI